MVAPGPPTPTTPVTTGCSAFAAVCATDQGPQEPVDVVAADLDGDGDLDLVVVNAGSDDISVFLNQGDRTFAPSVNIRVAQGEDPPQAIEAGDLDGDGDVDLVIAVRALFEEENVVVLLNHGDAKFAPFVPVPAEVIVDGQDVGFSPSRVVLTDLDGDNDLDLVALGWTGSLWVRVDGNLERAEIAPQMVVRLNNGDATFGDSLASPAAVVFDPKRVSTGDYNGDGDMDVAVLNDDNDSWVISVLFNAGNGTFDPPVAIPIGEDSFGRALASADLDGDGDVDLAVITSGEITVFDNNGAGVFTDSGRFTTGVTLSSLTVADLDGDGDPDLAVTGFFVEGILVGDGVSVLLNDGDGTFGHATVYLDVGSDPTALTAADLDGDGALDLVMVNEGSNNGTILFNNGDGTFALGGG